MDAKQVIEIAVDNPVVKQVLDAIQNAEFKTAKNGAKYKSETLVAKHVPAGDQEIAEFKISVMAWKYQAPDASKASNSAQKIAEKIAKNENADDLMFLYEQLQKKLGL